MICADELRKRTYKIIKKKERESWKNIKERIKIASKNGDYSTIFKYNELSEDSISILEALGYTVFVCKSCFTVPDRYRVSWEQPSEYWDDETFKLG